MQVKAELSRGADVATQKTCVAQCIHQGPVLPQWGYIKVDHAPFQPKSQISGNVRRQDTCQIRICQGGGLENGIRDPAKLHSKLNERQAHMIQPLYIAGRVALTSQKWVVVCNHLMGQWLGSRPQSGVGALKVSSKVHGSGVLFGAGLTMQSQMKSGAWCFQRGNHSTFATCRLPHI